MTTDRNRTARSAADLLEASGEPPPALIGFDGFIDSILDVVDTRHDMSPGGYTPIRTISRFAERIGSAAGRSMNLELVEREERWGGNGPLLAGALARLGVPVTYIGAVGGGGNPPEDGRLHPAYAPLAGLCRRVIPLSLPGRTRALEFDDGKVMLNEPANVQAVVWDRVLASVGGEGAIAEILRPAGLLGIVNWSLLGGVEGILRGLLEGVLPRLNRREADGRPLLVYVDLSDPAKRTDADLRRLLLLLGELNARAPLTLGVNFAEAERLARLLGSTALEVGGLESLGDAAATLRSRLDLAGVVIHTHRGAGASQAIRGSEERATFAGPFVARPAISTGAGDHFNAGVALGQVLGMPLAECLALGCAVGGLYVREAAAPSRERLQEFLRDLPRPESVEG